MCVVFNHVLCLTFLILNKSPFFGHLLGKLWPNIIKNTQKITVYLGESGSFIAKRKINTMGFQKKKIPTPLSRI